jgi:hypothetical protein
MQAAGAAAEVATGQDYIDVFADRITTPLEMTNTQFVLASDSNPRVAGGIESTATDFGRFMDMLLNDGVDRATGTRVLTAASVAEMLTRQTSDDQIIVNSPADNNRYGIGVWVDQLVQAGPPVDALAAGARGFHSWIDKNYGLVMTFATEETSFSNVEVLSSMMHLAILQAVAQPGDFNFDGIVDGADLLAWQRGQSPSPLSAGDLAVWQANYGDTLPAVLHVPEPSTLWIVTVACGLATLRRNWNDLLGTSKTLRHGRFAIIKTLSQREPQLLAKPMLIRRLDPFGECRDS